ncbi:MAG: glycosyltransferase family 4 protein [Clostridiales bacterium]|nr:glycosyltransferase family 4 protein [Clostridiales bacterium]
MEERKTARKKVIVITNHSYMLYRFRKELIEAMMEQHEVVLVMPFTGHEEDFQAMGLRCINTELERRGINPFTDLKLVKTYREILKKEKPDCVITYSIKPNIYAGYLCSRMRIPYYANVQGLGTAFQKAGLAQFVTMLYKSAFRKVQKVFFENETNAEEFRQRGILGKEKQVVLHGAGINLKEYAYTPYQVNDPVHFLYLGRIMKEKGMDELFGAVRQLHGEGYPFILDLVGFFDEGNDEYKNQAEQLEAEGILKYHGFQENPQPFYVKADCIVMPSYHEGLSNVLLEAAAQGRPVITTDIPGCREAVEHRKTGLLCRAQDEDSLYRTMKEFLTLPVEEREAYGKAGRAKMEREFDKQAVVAETLNAISAIHSGR